MISVTGRPSLEHTRAVAATLVLALISAVILVLLASDVRSASAQAPPDPIARAWGINSFGQLGDDSFAPRSKQVPVVGEGGVGSLGNVTSLEGGQNHTVALKNGTAYAWGHNGSGQLGYDPDPSTSLNEDSDRPAPVSGLTDVLAVAAGSNFSIALVSDGAADGVGNDGTVWTWGDNFRGQLGNNSPVGSSNTPVQVTSENGLGSLTDVVAVAAGSSHSLAVKSDGTVWAWGYDGFGQLGDSTSHPSNQSHKPVQVQDVGGSGFLTGVSSVAGGGLHSLAVKSDGTVYAWGYNGTGGLGNGGGPDSNTPVQVKGVGGVGFLGGAASVAAGSEHSLALKGDGTLWAWGNNFRGQVGDGTSGNQRNTPVQVSNENGSGFLTGVTDIAAGAEQSLAAVSPHGTVWAWGRNEFGSLGNGSFSGNFSRPVQAIQLIGATQVAAGDFHSLAVANADTTPPDTTIDPASVPPANSNSPSATFEFSSNELDSTFSCRRYLVGSTPPPYNTCSSPTDYNFLSDGQHTFEVRARDVAGNFDPTPASHTWTVDTTAPSAPVIEDPDDDSYRNDGAFDVSGTAEPNSTVTIFQQPSGGPEEQKGTVTADASSGNWSTGVTVPAGEYTYTAETKDAVGNTSTRSSAVTVTVDMTAPTLDTDNSDGSDSVTPNNGARGVSRLTNVTATFSEDNNMDPTTLDPSTFTLTRVGATAPVDASVSYDAATKTVTLDPFPSNPKQKLAKRKTYTVKIEGAKDLAGNPLATTTWSFKSKRR